MKILLIGGTGFIGPPVVRELLERGHQIALYHRGNRPNQFPGQVEQIFGDRNRLAGNARDLRRFAPDVVVDFLLSSGRQAEALMDVFNGFASRVVALSSGDVYRAAGILHGFESEPLQPLPLVENSELRTIRNVYGPEILDRLRAVLPWLDTEYDKIPVEEQVMSDPRLPGTVLRLPMVYGPGDPLHRLFPYLKRMDDNRKAILLQGDAADWRGPRGYVENVAAAIALATVSSRAAGRIYNVAEPHACSEEEWIRGIGQLTNWNGRILRMSKEFIPAHLGVPYRNEQHWIMSSSRIREELGFAEPVSESLALERTIAWERSHPPSGATFDYAAEDAAIAFADLSGRSGTAGPAINQA